MLSYSWLVIKILGVDIIFHKGYFFPLLIRDTHGGRYMV